MKDETEVNNDDINVKKDDIEEKCIFQGQIS